MSHGFGFLVLVLLGGLALAGMFRGLLEGFEAPKDEQNAGSVPVTGSAKLVLGPASLGPASLGPASLVGPPGPKGDKGILNIHLTGSVYPSNEKNRKQKKNDKVKLNLSFPIDVPKKAIYEIISSSFDSEEVNDELEVFIKNQISEDLILDSLFDSIKELIKTRYKID